MEPKVRDLSWPGVQDYLREVHEHLPELVEKGVLVGGAACLYHRFRFEAVEHAEFTLRRYSEAEEQQWLSKDVDFALLPDMDLPDTQGLRVGTLQFGFRLAPEEFNENAKTVTLSYPDGEVLHVKIADTIDLYREKEAGVERRNQPHDHLHFEMLREIVVFQICKALEARQTPAASDFIARARTYCIELFNDQRVKNRLAAIADDAIES